MTTAIQELKSIESQRNRIDQQAYRQAVQKLADGKQVDSAALMELIDRLHKSTDDIEGDVLRLRNRREWFMQYRAGEEASAELRTLEERRERATKEADEVIAKSRQLLGETLRDIDQKSNGLQNTLRLAHDARVRLSETLDAEQRRRFEDVEQRQRELMSRRSAIESQQSVQRQTGVFTLFRRDSSQAELQRIEAELKRLADELGLLEEAAILESVA